MTSTIANKVPRGSYFAVTALLISMLALGLATGLPKAVADNANQLADRLQQALHDDPHHRQQAMANVPEIDELLDGGLTRSEAVAIALINNSDLQAAFESLGVTRAQLAQAGLYSNPEIDTVLRYPEGDGSAELEIEAGWNLADLWIVPIRRNVHRNELQRATMLVINEMLNTIADAKRAHDQCVLAAAIRDRAADVYRAGQDLRDRVRHRFDYGYTTALDMSMADADVGEWQAQLAKHEADLQIAKAGLQRVLGLESAEIKVAGEVPQPPFTVPQKDGLVQFAFEHRPDLQAARHGIRAARAELALQRKSTWQHVMLGPAYAHEPDGEESWGLMLGVELPLFDNNRAQRARARAKMQTAQTQLAALESRIRQQVLVAFERLSLAVRQQNILADQVIPARKRGLDYSVRYYNEMQLNMMYLLEARRDLFMAHKSRLGAVKAVRDAQVELEFVLGGVAPVDHQ